MTASRPPVPDRWEFQLGMTLLNLVQEAQRRATSGTPRRGPGTGTARGLSDEPAWMAQLARERMLLRTGVALWLAWRSYRLETRARQQG